jgi:hypothetical protein
MVTEKDYVNIKITPEIIEQAKALSKAMYGSFGFRLDETIKKRNDIPSSVVEKWCAVPLRRVVFGYWYEMNILKTYSGSGQMNYYYNCIIKMAELGIDVNKLSKNWHDKAPEWKQDFEEGCKWEDEHQYLINWIDRAWAWKPWKQS